MADKPKKKTAKKGVSKNFQKKVKKIDLPKGVKAKASIQKGGSIDDIKQQMTAGSDRYLQLKDDGDSKEIIFLQDPAEWVRFRQHRTGQGESFRGVPCVGDGCPLCASGNRPSSRAGIVVFDVKDKKNKIFWASGEVVADLLSKAVRRKTLKDRIYTITREGTMLNTKYYFEREDEKVDKDLLKKQTGKKLMIDPAEDLQQNLDSYYADDEGDEDEYDDEDEFDEIDDDDEDEGDEEVEDDDDEDDEDDDEEAEVEDDDDDDDEEEEEEEVLPKKKQSIKKNSKKGKK